MTAVSLSLSLSLARALSLSLSLSDRRVAALDPRRILLLNIYAFTPEEALVDPGCSFDTQPCFSTAERSLPPCALSLTATSPSLRNGRWDGGVAE